MAWYSFKNRFDQYKSVYNEKCILVDVKNFSWRDKDECGIRGLDTECNRANMYENFQETRRIRKEIIMYIL